MSEFSWWLLIVGLVAGAGLTWLVLADSTRREAEVEARELPAEAAWIAESMADQGRPIDASDAEEVLRLHRSYLGVPPPDETRPANDGDEVEARDPAESTSPTDATDAATGEPARRPVRESESERRQGEPAA